ncbi:30S ribosomal protein S16 [bacterium]|nr:30S ribosomal protein S16 [bacterium]MBU1652582.1 30S ribosomal protein S16 [bacterium]MBU1880928.1 30S ribosomal protein S16 [bacterium]
MAVKLRLMRMGRKAQPFYRIVAVDSRNRRDGAFIEKIGHYNPLCRPAEVVIDDTKALKWLNRGAIPSDTVRNLFSRRGVMMAFALHKKGIAEEEIWNKVSQFRLDKEAALKAKEETVIAAQEKKVAPPPVKTEEKPVETAPVEETPAEAKAEEAAPAEEAPAEAKAEEAAPAEEAPAEAKAEEAAPAEEAPAEAKAKATAPAKAKKVKETTKAAPQEVKEAKPAEVKADSDAAGDDTEAKKAE